jgi:hypothetical protein
MKEKEIRERIERFLKRTARNVVVPASVGFSLTGCDSHALGSRRADAGRDAAGQQMEVADAASTDDLPRIAPPYLLFIPPDAGTGPSWADTASEAQALPDAGPDTPAVMPPYMIAPPPPYMVPAPAPPLPPAPPPPLPPPPPPPAPDAGSEVPMQPPPPAYLYWMAPGPPAPGGTAPLPLAPKKNG